MKTPEEDSGLDYINFVTAASQQIVIVEADTIRPVAFGSGCIVYYKDRTFLLSVAHVTNIGRYGACIETNLPPQEGKSEIYSVGSMCYFDQYKLPRNFSQLDIKGFQDLGAFFDKTLDITFCEVKEDITILQPGIDFGSYKVTKGHKIILYLDDAIEPEPGKKYGLFGKIRQKLVGTILYSQPTLKLGLQFQGKLDRFRYFLTPEIIKNKEDWEGCSGAPIIDEDGKLVGLASSIKTNSKLLFAFSIGECKKLLNIAIENKLV